MIERDSKIENIWHIFHYSRECYNVARYLNDPSSPEEKDVCQKDNSIFFIQHVFFRMAIIELSKLVIKSSNNHYSIDKFLKDIEETEIKELLELWEEHVKGIVS